MNVNTREPVYLQVVRHFKEQIAIGNFVAGQEIPPEENWRLHSI